jgi:hypothetical protein
MLSLVVGTVTREERWIGGGVNPTVTRTLVKTHRFSGGARVSLSATALKVSDFAGEDESSELVYLADSGEILSAIVDYVASMQRELQRAVGNGDTWQSAVENLQRIAGAMGLEYVAPTAAAAPTTLPEA